MLLAVCCDLGDAMRCALSCTSILSSMLQLTRCCLVSVWLLAGDAGSRAMRNESRRVGAAVVVRADDAGVAGCGGAGAGAVWRRRRLRSIWLEELRALGSMAVEEPIARCCGSEL